MQLNSVEQRKNTFRRWFLKEVCSVSHRNLYALGARVAGEFGVGIRQIRMPSASLP